MKNMKSIGRKSRRQHGNFLVEYGMALLLGAIALIGLLVFYTKYMNNQDTNTAIKDLNDLAANIKKDLRGQYSTITNAKLSTSGYFKPYPSLSDASGSVTLNAMGAMLTISPGNVNASNDSVQYVISNLNDAQCKDFASGVSGSSAKLLTNSAVIKSPGNPVNLANSTCAGNSNSVTFLIQ